MARALTHFTNSVENVTNILEWGFGWQRNDRQVIALMLPNVDFSEREPESFGQICFTENRCEIDRDGTKFFGRFGIQVSESWSERHNAQPVMYIADHGPVTESLRFLFTQTYQKAEAEQRYPDDAARQMWEISSVMAGIGGQELYAHLLRIYQFMEPARHSNESEWRIVNPNPDWGIARSTEEAIKEVSPPLGWAKHTRVLKLEIPDVEAISCPHADRTELENSLPETFRSVPIRPY